MEQKLKAHKVMITGASGGLGERIAYHRRGRSGDHSGRAEETASML